MRHQRECAGSQRADLRAGNFEPTFAGGHDVKHHAVLHRRQVQRPRRRELGEAVERAAHAQEVQGLAERIRGRFPEFGQGIVHGGEYAKRRTGRLRGVHGPGRKSMKRGLAAIVAPDRRIDSGRKPNRSTELQESHNDCANDSGTGWHGQDGTPHRRAADRSQSAGADRLALGDAVVRLGEPQHLAGGPRERGRRVHLLLSRSRGAWRDRCDPRVHGACGAQRRATSRAVVRPRRARGPALRRDRHEFRCAVDGAPLQLVQPELQRELPARTHPRGRSRVAGVECRSSRSSMPTTSPMQRSRL